MKYKILDEYFLYDERIKKYIRYARIKPYKDGGKEKIIMLDFDSKPPFNTLLSENGYREVGNTSETKGHYGGRFDNSDISYDDTYHKGE